MKSGKQKASKPFYMQQKKANLNGNVEQPLKQGIGSLEIVLNVAIILGATLELLS